MTMTGIAGRWGEKVRSDCRVEVEPRAKGGVDLEVHSKVERLYGESIRKTCLGVLKSLGVKNARVKIEDTGALEFALAARLETAVKRARLAQVRESLPEPGPGLIASSRRERFRRSRLYLPGNEPKYFTNAALHEPDGVILDLEDSVAPSEKDAARLLVRNALRTVDFKDAERMVRINQGEMGFEDLEAVIPQNVHVILIPKVESPQQVKEVDERAEALRRKAGLESPVMLMPIIESALGCFKALEIASASPNVVALTIGLEDYTADIGAARTSEGKESLWARQVVVNAARAAGVTPIDTVFSDVGDMEGLKAAALEAKGLGFEGKGCIHPRQVPVVNRAFAPAQEDIEKAARIVTAFEQAEREGAGVVSLGSKMIDPPIVKRALRTVEMAEDLGLLPENWRKNNR
ncbi:MAG: citrate lyase acyl carrier protein [Acidobacteriota bacterium]|jgi:citrate lyase subunit beta / citryl-CoA lyase